MRPVYCWYQLKKGLCARTVTAMHREGYFPGRVAIKPSPLTKSCRRSSEPTHPRSLSNGANGRYRCRDRIKEARDLHTRRYPRSVFVCAICFLLRTLTFSFYLRFTAASASDAVAARNRFLDSFRIEGVAPSKRASVPPQLSCTPPLIISEREHGRRRRWASSTSRLPAEPTDNARWLSS